MIGWLKGTLRRKDTTHLLLEASGVGYQVAIPFSTLFSIVLPDWSQQ